MTYIEIAATKGSVERGVAPAAAVRALRQIDERADLMRVNGDQWWLVTYDPVDTAIARARREIKELTKAGRVLTMALHLRLAMLEKARAGYRNIQLYEPGTTFAEIQRDFAERDYNYRVRPEETYLERESESLFEAELAERQRKMTDYFQTEVKTAYRYLVKSAKGFWQRVNPLAKGTQ